MPAHIGLWAMVAVAIDYAIFNHGAPPWQLEARCSTNGVLHFIGTFGTRPHGLIYFVPESPWGVTEN